MNKFDKIFKISLLSKMFVNGWGNPDLLQKIIENHKYVSKRETCKDLVKSFHVITNKVKESSDAVIIEGKFLSPLHDLLPDVMDENNRIARFELLVPKVWNGIYKPLCIHYPGTGDHQYFRRRVLAKRLLKDGIASLIHINPYYGNRKPKDQKRSSLNYLSDLFVMGGALILETQVLLRWAEQEAFHPLAVHGISMGGHMACLGVSVYPKPICLIPCLSWTTASHVFTQAAMSYSVPWDVLTRQYNSNSIYRTKIREAIQPPIPLHLNRSYKAIQTEIISNEFIREENKLKIPFDNMERKLHFMIPNKDNLHIQRRNYSNDENMDGSQKNSRFANLRTSLSTFPWNRSLDSSLISNSVPNAVNTREIKEMQNKNMRNNRMGSADLETIEFMRDILDYFTHLGNYSTPYDTRLATIVVAGNDAYIPIEGVSHFHEVWDSRCDIRIREGIGHVEAYFRNLIKWEDLFREGIVDTLNRFVQLYHNEEGPFGQKKSQSID